MASKGIFRQFQITTWTDVWFMDLSVDEKLLFIYLFTSRESNMIGLYEITIKTMSFYTGLSIPRIEEILAKFADDKKVYYSHADSIVWVVNMRRYNETRSESVQTYIKNLLAEIPECSLKNNHIKYYGDILPPPIKSIGIGAAGRKPETTRFEEMQQAEDFADACEVFATVTGQMAFQTKTQAEDIRRVNVIIAKHGKDKAKDYLQQYFNHWCNRKGKDGRPYSKMNTGWLDWAIAGEIPAEAQPAHVVDKIGPYLGS